MAEEKLSKLSVRDLDLEGKRVFVRVDFNVPLDQGKVSDDTRIQAALPTISHLREAGARVILASHLGRPKGEKKAEFSLEPVALHLASILDEEVIFPGDCVGSEVEAAVRALEPAGVLLLENVRFYPGETSNDAAFAKEMASCAQEYVNDAFGTAHRAHASTVGVPTALGKGAAGLLIEKELAALSKALHGAEEPVVAVFGGAKVSDKIDVIRNFIGLADSILLGGGMAFTFLKAQGHEIGNSILEEDKVGLARELLEKSRQEGVELVLPVDFVVAAKLEAGTETSVVSADSISAGEMGLDIGPRTVEEFKVRLGKARTVIWNGPLGVFEIEEFSQGTLGIAQAVAESQSFSVVGGGDSVAAVKKAGVSESISHISTGGGASLDFLAGKELPGIAVLTDK